MSAVSKGGSSNAQSTFPGANGGKGLGSDGGTNQAADPAAVKYLRRRTVGRAADSYRRWVGRAVGWWTILYLLFWLVIFAIAGVESLAPLAQPLPTPALVLAGVAVLVLVLALIGGRAPPLTLDRRDLYRMALGSQMPWHVLRWRYRVTQVGRVVVALIAGVVWSLLAPALFGFSALYAAPALALLTLLHLDLRWLRYVANPMHGEHAARKPADNASLLLGGAALALLAVTAAAVYLAGNGGQEALANGAGPALTAPAVAPNSAGSLLIQALNPVAALTLNSPLALIVPLLLAVLSQLAVRRSLTSAWPPRFAPQSLVLTQIQALRTFQMMSALAGMGAGGSGLGGAFSDDGERRRLLDSLHDRPGATRPRRSLPLPRVNAPQWAALAWRSAAALYRRPLLRLGLTLLVALSAAAAVLVASGAGLNLTAVGEGAPTSVGAASGGGTAGLFGGALGILLAALFAARAASGLLGPHFDIGVRPVDPLTRSFGRTAPALALLMIMLLPATALLAALGLATGGVPDLAALLPAAIGAASILGLVVLALEKYSNWSGAAASRIEPQLVAAMLAALPALLLGAFGVGEWTMITQILLLGLVTIIPA